MTTPRWPLPLILAAALAAAAGLPAQTPPPGGPSGPPPAPPRKEAKEPKAPKDGKTAPKEGPNRERILRDALARLQPEQRKQVLQALDHVWKDEGVKAAREQLKQASDTYKRELRDALAETSPEVQPVLGPLLEQLARTGLPDLAPRKGTERPRYHLLLGLDLAQATEEERRWLNAVRDAVMADPRLHAQRQVVEKTQPPARAAAFLEQVRLARTLAVEKDPRLQALFDRLPPRLPAPGDKPPGPPEGKASQ